MTISFKSAGVSARVINLTGPTATQPLGIPAGVIGTSQKGPAFIPLTVATTQDFTVVFGDPADDKANGPLAVSEWLANQQAATYVRVLGVGQGKKRETAGDNQGRVAGAGFVVGDQQPTEAGALGDNTYANAGGPTGRLYFLNAFMSESNGSGFLSDAGLPGRATPLVRGVIMAASGVVLRLSSSVTGTVNAPPASNLVASDATASGSVLGSANLSNGRQEFVLLLNGHKGTDTNYPRVITASLDASAPNYIGRSLNTDPLKTEEAGHLLYADYSIHPNIATVTGSGVFSAETDDIVGGLALGIEPVVFLSTGSVARNSGSTTAPSYENWEDRFATPKSTWIVSQKFGGKPQNLFRLHALDDGTWDNDRIKWSIENLTPSVSDANPYGTFDLLVRRFSDTDKTKQTVEAWRKLSLNPSSDNYIARVIGDTHNFYNFDAADGSQKVTEVGDYPNRSSVVRVEVATSVDNEEVDSTALPMGFRGPAHLATSGSAPLAAVLDTTSSLFLASDPAFDVVQMPVPYRENINLGAAASQRADKGLYWGVQFERKLSVSEPNSTTEPERSIAAYTKYFPDFQTDYLNVLVSNNQGTLDTTENGILDADRFNNNLFSLENVQITQTAALLADASTLTSWSYVRTGNITDTGAGGVRALTASDLSDSSVRQVAKFSGIIQGGFDGVRIFDNDTAELTNAAILEEMDNANRGTSAGATVSAYKKALDIIVDDVETDIQLLTIPGIRHPIITDDALIKVEERFDAMYIMDTRVYDTTNTLVSSSTQDVSVRFTANNHTDRGLNTSFGAAYFPDVIIRDARNNITRQVPPSVAVLGAFGLNDAVGHPWFAPAGFARGSLKSTEQTILPLSRDNMDSLQDAKINPLVTFAGSNGVTVWGQRTLLGSDSALERVSVRRLLINLRRQVREVSKRFVFEQGRAETLARFSQLVNPIMKRVQDQSGLEKFLVKIDTTTTTQADIENRTIRGQIFLVPTRTLEFLSINFAVTNQATFVTSI